MPRGVYVRPVRPQRMADCHSDRPHYGKGFCKPCYDIQPERIEHRRRRRSDPDLRAMDNARSRARKREVRADPGLRAAENARERQRRHNDPDFHERQREYMRQRRTEAEFRARQNETSRQRRALLKVEMIAAYGGGCSCCGETEPAFLTLEHLNGDGKEHRAKLGATERMLLDLKRRGWPKDGYTVLCFNCNHAKSLNGGVCPHEMGLLRLVTA